MFNEKEYRKKCLEKQYELGWKDEWTDADKLIYMLCDIQPHSFYWRHGMVKALKRAIKLLEKEDGK